MSGKHTYKPEIDTSHTNNVLYDCLYAEKKYADTFYMRLITCFRDLSPQERGRKIEQLIALAEQAEQEVRLRKQRSRFEKEKAITIRKQAGLTVKQLSLEIHVSTPTIYRFEKGISTQLSKHSNTKSMAYFYWLKERGYNPFDL